MAHLQYLMTTKKVMATRPQPVTFSLNPKCPSCGRSRTIESHFEGRVLVATCEHCPFMNTSRIDATMHMIDDDKTIDL